MSLFAISNIHGNNLGFQRILKQAKFTKQDTLVVLGDCIDIGPDSKGVLDTLFLLKDRGFKVICIKGDHEQMILNAYGGSVAKEKWMRQGGQNTLESFKCSDLADIPTSYIEFLKKLPNFYMTEKYYFVHGGIDMTLDQPLRNTQSLLTLSDWREKYVEGWLNGSLVIHGHTPLTQLEITAQYSRGFDVIGIDNGNQRIQTDAYGKLCLLNVDEKLFFFEE